MTNDEGRRTNAVRPQIVGGPAVDARSEKVIRTLHPRVQPYARCLVVAARGEGIVIVVTSGLRTYAEQDALFAQRPKVTNARGGYSNHNFGIAFDVTIFAEGEPVWESPHYKVVGRLGQQLGLEWGGAWTTFKDEPHFELRPPWARGTNSAMLAELRKRKASGKDYWA